MPRGITATVSRPVGVVCARVVVGDCVERYIATKPHVHTIYRYRIHMFGTICRPSSHHRDSRGAADAEIAPPEREREREL